MSMANQLIINAAITGMVPGKNDTPHVPISVAEIVAGIRAASDLVVCVSLSGRLVADIGNRLAGLKANPDLASLTLGSLNFMTQPSINAPATIALLAECIHAAGAVPELEIFEAGFANTACHLVKRGILKPPHYANIILGSLGSAPFDPIGLGHLVSLLPPGTTWSVGGIGRFQLDANVMAIAAGGHVRTGLEDNLFYDRERRELADNARLVERIARIGREMGREPATPAEARAIIGLPGPT
jgi:3-keto-5-aminohexanoate cleavage enzyme